MAKRTKDPSELKKLLNVEETAPASSEEKSDIVYGEGVTKAGKSGFFKKHNPVSVERKARAPYNFIPLNDLIITTEAPPKNDRYYYERLTGFINVKVTTKTPVYIRDTYTENEYNEFSKINDEDNKEFKKLNSDLSNCFRKLDQIDKKISKLKTSKADKENEIKKLESEKVKLTEEKDVILPKVLVYYNKLWKHSDFFSPGSGNDGRARIPGSSLRGLIRSMTEIVTFGGFKNFEDKYLYYRDVGGSTVLGKDYRNKINKDTIFSGILKKMGHKSYKIFPSEVDSNGYRYYRISKTECERYETGGKIFFNRNGMEPKWKITNFSIKRADDKPNFGYLVKTGHFEGKKFEWVINPPPAECKGIDIDYDEVVSRYIKDENRNNKGDFNILSKAEKKNIVAPCFYILEKDKIEEFDHDIKKKDKVAGFGHNPFFRLSYDETIGKHIYPESKKSEIIDITEAIFGNEKKFAGRVFFEDCFCEKNLKDAAMEPANPRILSNPKPTSFQHYLTQETDDKELLFHYNPIDDKRAVIRGYKLYWHKGKNNRWSEEEKNTYKHLKQYNSKIAPIKDNTSFTGKIRFENLTEIELGALLFALDLPKECYHKIGMAKPYGLGSVKIQPELYLSDRRKRYENFEFEFGEIKKSDIIEYKTAFEKFVKTNLKIDGNLWESERLNELRIMLDADNPPYLFDKNSTEYMDMNKKEFINRPVLPKPSDIERK